MYNSMATELTKCANCTIDIGSMASSYMYVTTAELSNSQNKYIIICTCTCMYMYIPVLGEKSDLLQTLDLSPIHIFVYPRKRWKHSTCTTVEPFIQDTSINRTPLAVLNTLFVCITPPEIRTPH